MQLCLLVLPLGVLQMIRLTSSACTQSFEVIVSVDAISLGEFPPRYMIEFGADVRYAAKRAKRLSISPQLSV